MPRPPKFIHPVRTLRQELKKSQEQFAKMVGISASLLKKIELGQRNMSETLSLRIMSATGVTETSILKKTGKPMLMGLPYSGDFFKKFSGHDVDESARDYALIQPIAFAFFENSLAAACERGKLHAFLAAYNYWLQNALDEFGIRETADRRLKDQMEKIEACLPSEARKNTKFPKKITRGALNSPIEWKRNRILRAKLGELEPSGPFGRMLSRQPLTDGKIDQKSPASADETKLR